METEFMDGFESLCESEGFEEQRAALPAFSPSPDFGRFTQRYEDLPLHQQPKMQRPIGLQLYRGPTGPPTQASRHVRKTQKLRLARLAHLDGDTKAKVSRSVQTASVKSWLHNHGYVVKADKLHPAVTRVIAEWFSLVDDDNSKTLEHRELLAALKAAQVPCDDATIKEMIHMMDMNKDGVIDWDEFEVFMTEEFAAGKSLLSGEYVLPSGLSLNFGVMISKLKRNKLLTDIMQDTRRRNKWAAIASSPEALVRELATMQEAAEATSLTMEHLTRSEADGLGLPTPRTQLTTALVRAAEAAEARGPRPVRAEEPGLSLKEKLRATAMGIDVTRQSQFYDSTSPFSSATIPHLRAVPDPTAAPPTPPQHPGEAGFYMTGMNDPLMLQQPLASYVSEGFPTFSAHITAGLQSGSRSATPGVGTRAPDGMPVSAAAGTSSISPVFPATPPRLVTSQQANHDSSRPMSTLGLQPPQRPSGPSSAPVPSLNAPAGAGLGSPSPSDAGVGPTASALYPGSVLYSGPEGTKELMGWSTPLRGAWTSSRRMRNTDQADPHGQRGSGGSQSGSPAAAALPLRGASASSLHQPHHRHNHLRSPSRSGTGSAGAGHAPTARSSGARPGLSSSSGSGTGADGEPRYAASHTAASRSHRQPVSRTISLVGMMAQELRAAAGKVPLEPSPTGLPVTALCSVSRSVTGYTTPPRDTAAAPPSSRPSPGSPGLVSPAPMSPFNLVVAVAAASSTSASPAAGTRTGTGAGTRTGTGTGGVASTAAGGHGWRPHSSIPSSVPVHEQAGRAKPATPVPPLELSRLHNGPAVTPAVAASGPSQPITAQQHALQSPSSRTGLPTVLSDPPISPRVVPGSMVGQPGSPGHSAATLATATASQPMRQEAPMSTHQNKPEPSMAGKPGDAAAPAGAELTSRSERAGSGAGAAEPDSRGPVLRADAAAAATPQTPDTNRAHATSPKHLSTPAAPVQGALGAPLARAGDKDSASRRSTAEAQEVCYKRPHVATLNAVGLLGPATGGEQRGGGRGSGGGSGCGSGSGGGSHGDRPGSSALHRFGSTTGGMLGPATPVVSRPRLDSGGSCGTPTATFQRVPSSTRSLLVHSAPRAQQASGPLLGGSISAARPTVAPALNLGRGGGPSGSGNRSSSSGQGHQPGSASPAGETPGDGHGRPSSRVMGGAHKAPPPPLEPPSDGRPVSRSRVGHGLGGDSKDDLMNPSWSAAAASMLQLRLSRQLNDPDTISL